jgi:Bacterial self-protective colicin-like immunity
MTQGDVEAVEHVDLVRRYVNREITADDFVSDFIAARERWIEALGNRLSNYEGLLNDMWFDVDRHNAYDDLREPDEFDDEALRASMARRLRDWDAGTYVTQYE